MKTISKFILIVAAAYYVCWQLVVLLNKIIGPVRPATHSNIAEERETSPDFLHPQR